MKKIICCLLPLLLLSLLCQGQQALSLSKAIQTGLRNNYQVQISNLRTEISKKNQRTGPQEQLPSVDFRLNQSNNFSFDSSPTSFVDGAYSDSDVSAQVDASWTIFDGHQVKINKTRLGQLTEKSEAFAQLAIENAIHGIMLSYYEVLMQQEKLRVLLDVKELSAKKLEWARTLNESGAMSDYNLLNYQNIMLADSIQLEYQKIRCKRSMNKLKAAMGTKTKRSFRLTDPLKVSTRDFSYKNSSVKLVRKNKDLRNQYINLDLRENQNRLLRAARSPKVQVRSGLSQEISTSKFRDEERINGRVFDYYVNFAVSYNLTGRRQLDNRIQVAEIEKRIATLEKEEIKRRLDDQLYLACETYQDNLRILNIKRQLIRNLEKGIDIQEERFDSGYTHFLEFRSLQSEYLQSRLESFEILYDLKMAELEILKLTGGLSSN